MRTFLLGFIGLGLAGCASALWLLVMLLQEDEPVVNVAVSPVIGDLTIEAFSEVVRATVLQTLADCSVEGKMQGKAKINFDVAGYVTAHFTCDVEPDD
ncbi:hypothetical protein N9Y37_10005 [Luminiphilus sp.]|nr:hypothetical protein [Luminiphilus sp.]